MDMRGARYFRPIPCEEFFPRQVQVMAEGADHDEALHRALVFLQLDYPGFVVDASRTEFRQVPSIDTSFHDGETRLIRGV